MSRWKVYKAVDGDWRGTWIVRPPGAHFGECFGFRTFRRAMDYATQQASIGKS